MNRTEALEMIIDYAAFIFDAPNPKQRKRDRNYLHARAAAVHYAYHKLGMTYNDIGKVLGGRHHASIMNMERMYEQYYRWDKNQKNFDGIVEFASSLNVATDNVKSRGWRDRYIERLTRLCRAQHETIIELNAEVSK